MYVLMTKRVVKHNTGNTAKFAPRTSNSVTWEAIGPFQTRKAATRALIAAAAVHTTLSAEIITAVPGGYPCDAHEGAYGWANAVNAVKRMLADCPSPRPAKGSAAALAEAAAS